MIEVKISSNAKEIETAFVKIGQNIKNFPPVLRQSGEYMLGSIKRNFLSQGRPSPWKPLSPVTIAMRRKGKGGRSDQILMDTGALFNSIWYDVGEDSVKIGTGLKYAKMQHFGGTSKIPAHIEKVKSHYRQTKGKRIRVSEFSRKAPARTFVIPSRKFIMFQEDDVPALQDIFVRFVKKSIDEGKQ